MRTSQQITWDQLRAIVEAVYEQGPVVVREADSAVGCATKQFADARDLLEGLKFEPGIGEESRQYALYYPEAKGYCYEERIALDPRRCKGATFRICQRGWGLIQLQCNFRKHPWIECDIAANSEERAIAWSGTYPECRSPAAWDWAVVNKKAGRLIRLLRRLGKENSTGGD